MLDHIFSFAPVGLFENPDEFQIMREGEECLSRQREPNFNIASLYSIAKRNPTCEDAGKSRNRGSFFFESGIESSIESGYTQIPRAGSI